MSSVFLSTIALRRLAPIGAASLSAGLIALLHALATAILLSADTSIFRGDLLLHRLLSLGQILADVHLLVREDTVPEHFGKSTRVLERAETV